MGGCKTDHRWKLVVPITWLVSLRCPSKELEEMKFSMVDHQRAGDRELNANSGPLCAS